MDAVGLAVFGYGFMATAHIEALLSRDQEIAKANLDADVRRHAAVMQAMAPPAQGVPNA